MKPQLRVFLSADLVGSTKLKNRLNHEVLLDKYQSHQKLVKDVAPALNYDEASLAILRNLGIGGTHDYDWANVLNEFYTDIHSTYCKNRENKDLKCWKAIGDELIFSELVESRVDLHRITIAFLKTIREINQKYLNPSSERGVRVKGAAWVAGFPVRNRVLRIPGHTDTQDYLGPEMDTGFRIAKCTRAGMLVISTEMAELLAGEDGDHARMRAMVVGWEKLGGVWNDQRYPVIWVEFPEDLCNASKLKATDLSDWEQAECGWCKKWSDDQHTELRSIISLRDRLIKLRESLPKSLGIVAPYITGDGDPVHERHQEILDLIDRITEQEKKSSDQNEEAHQSENTVESDMTKVEGVFAAIDPTSSD